MRPLNIAPALGALVLGGCSLHPTNNDSGGPINLAASREFVFVAGGTSGLRVMYAETATLAFSQPPSGRSDSYDDVSYANGHLYVLDADDGLLSTYEVLSDGKLESVSADVDALTGPYSGVTANEKSVVVSGGTCSVSVFGVDAGAPGVLGTPTLHDVYRGIPDATSVQGREQVILSAHFSGAEEEFVDASEFGIAVLGTDSGDVLDAAGLVGAGFTDGGGTPASWPVRVEVVGSRVLVAHGGGLSRFSLDPSGSLDLISHLALEGSATDVSSRDGKAFVVSAAPNTLTIVDLAPAGMSIESTSPLPEEATPTGVVVTDGWVFVAAEGGLLTLAR